MLIAPQSERLVAFVKITERTILSARCPAGERFRITRRSDGRFGYSVWLPPAPGRREWIQTGSATSEEAARSEIETAIKDHAA